MSFAGKVIVIKGASRWAGILAVPDESRLRRGIGVEW